MVRGENADANSAVLGKVVVRRMVAVLQAIAGLAPAVAPKGIAGPTSVGRRKVAAQGPIVVLQPIAGLARAVALTQIAAPRGTVDRMQTGVRMETVAPGAAPMEIAARGGNVVRGARDGRGTDGAHAAPKGIVPMVRRVPPRVDLPGLVRGVKRRFFLLGWKRQTRAPNPIDRPSRS